MHLVLVGEHPATSAAMVGVQVKSEQRSPLPAPTWSWVSVNDSVDMICLSELPAIKLLGTRQEDYAIKVEAAVIVKVMHTTVPTKAKLRYFLDS